MKSKDAVLLTVLGTISTISLLSSVGAENKFQKLSGAQIQAKLTGMEVTDESHWGEVLNRNGTILLNVMGHKSEGKWRVQKDQLCLDHGKEPGGGCYEVWLAGNKVELRSKESSVPLEGILQKPTDR
jgi:hypothetical protein